MSKNIIIRPCQSADGKRHYGLYYMSEIIGLGDDAPAFCYMPTLFLACSLVRFMNGGNMTKDEREMLSVAFRRAANTERSHRTDKKKHNTEEAEK